MNTRLQPVRAYWRKTPVRPDAYFTVHAELEAARRVDRILEEFVDRLEIEIERDLAEGVSS